MTLDLVREVRFDSAFMFAYSERAGTLAARRKPDDVPTPVKKARLARLIELQESISKAEFAKMVGQEAEILIQGPSRRDPNNMIGRTSCFRTTIVPDVQLAPGELVPVRIVGATSHTLFGERLER
jgi:tRNA-2-methylthio-N6-dimethylallyladenosine synthase